MKSPWPTKKLGEICEERKEKNINNENLSVFTVSHIYGLIPYQNIFYKQVHSKDTKNYKIVNRYDFAFGLPTKDTLPYGLLENEDKVLVSPAYVVFSIKNKNLLFPRFLYYLLKTNYYKWKIIEMAKSQSATRHGLPLKFHHLANLEISLPPLPIQQKIVKILDTIQSAVEIQEKIIEKTKELKKSLMAELFKYGAPSFRKGRKLKKTEIGEIPEDWEVVRLGRECEVFSGFAFSSSDFTSEGIPVIKIGNLQDGTIVLDQRTSFYPKEKLQDNKNKLSKYILKEGDVLIALTGATTGKTAVVPREFSGALLNQRVGKFNVFSKNLNLQFARYFFMSRYFQEKILESILQSAQGNVSPKQVEQVKIPLPPLPEQQEIAEILQTIDQKIEIEKKKKELYEELFKTMLNKIMSQEIDVEKIEI
jgi:type I restriction enzyme S subunit